MFSPQYLKTMILILYFHKFQILRFLLTNARFLVYTSIPLNNLVTSGTVTAEKAFLLRWLTLSMVPKSTIGIYVLNVPTVKETQRYTLLLPVFCLSKYFPIKLLPD